MNKPKTIITDDDELKEITIKDGSLVLLAIDDCMNEIHAFTKDGEKIGTFSFGIINSDCGEVLLICGMNLEEIPGYKRQGIGRQILHYARDFWGINITARSVDGIKHEDGSELIDNGPQFAHKMLIEGVLSPFDQEQLDLLEYLNESRAMKNKNNAF